MMALIFVMLYARKHWSKQVSEALLSSMFYRKTPKKPGFFAIPGGTCQAPDKGAIPSVAPWRNHDGGFTRSIYNQRLMNEWRKCAVNSPQKTRTSVCEPRLITPRAAVHAPAP